MLFDCAPLFAFKKYAKQLTVHVLYHVRCSLVPRPRPHKEGKGSGDYWVGCAESAVLLLGKPIRLQFSDILRDIYCNATCIRTRANHCK